MILHFKYYNRGGKVNKNAYGLNIEKREDLVKLAKTNCYYEAYLAERFQISVIAVRDICAKEGLCVCKKIEDGRHVDGKKLTKDSNGCIESEFCFCGPVLEYEDGKTGNKVFSHNISN